MLIRTTLLLIMSGAVMAQTKIDIEEHINSIISQGDETNNLNLYDLLIYYYDNPINLNKAESDELLQLGLLSKDQVEQIILYRRNTGAYQSIYELQALESLSLTDIKQLRPFIVVPATSSLLESFKGLGRASNNYFTASYGRLLEDVRGTNEGIYLGSPDKAQMRLRLRNPGKLSIGMVAQKDPGEPLLHNGTPDYFTGHVYIENHGRLNQLALGDYRLQFGQGLLLGAGFMAGKNVETVTTVKQSTIGILPYSSVTEANFFRGLASKVKIHERVNLSLFYSTRHLDATPGAEDSTIVTSIRTAGLHRTASERLAMDQLHEQMWGAALNYRAPNFAIGGLILSSRFNKNIMPQQKAYNFFRFAGRELTNYSLFGEYRFNNITWFSEVAKSQYAGWALNTGILGQVSRYAGISLSVRYLEKDFHSLYGRSFTERSLLGNENGIYWGLKLYPSRRITLSAYYDIYRFPWLTSTTAAPAQGGDIMARLEYSFNKTNKAFVQIRSEVVESAMSAYPVDQIEQAKIFKSILSFDYETTSTLSFRSRLQYNRFNQSEGGLLMLQDINYSTMKLGLSGRILFFATESFNTRQYVYEKDMLFTYNTRAFFGRGISYYLLIKYKPIRALGVRAKISFTEHLGVDHLGTGNNLIEGNTRTQFSMQLHYKF